MHVSHPNASLARFSDYSFATKSCGPRPFGHYGLWTWLCTVLSCCLAPLAPHTPHTRAFLSVERDRSPSPSILSLPAQQMVPPYWKGAIYFSDVNRILRNVASFSLVVQELCHTSYICQGGERLRPYRYVLGRLTYGTGRRIVLLRNIYFWKAMNDPPCSSYFDRT